MPLTPGSFLASMPHTYRKHWSVAQIQEHASVVAPKDGKSVRVKRCWAGTKPGESLICVVADDRPGLLATLSLALATNGLDVTRAKIYTRVRPDRDPQAVDFFWVRGSNSTPGEADARDRRAKGGPSIDNAGIDERIRLFETALKELLSKGGRDALSMPTHSVPERKTTHHETRVRFVEDSVGGLEILEVETRDRLGLLFCLTHALHAEGVNITTAEVSTVEGRVIDRFGITEVGGGRIGPARRLAVQVAVLAAILPAPSSAAPPSAAPSSAAPPSAN